MLFRYAAIAISLLCCSPAFAADTYQANLRPMPLDAANRSNMLGRGDATDGRPANWPATRLGTGVQGFPITFSAGGEQFIAVTTGTQGGSPVQKPSTMLQEVHRSQAGQAVYVFALPRQH